MNKIALGGGCHWCTEAVFQSLKGVQKVEQGYVAATEENSAFSEAVIVHFNADCIPLKRLIEIHLHTHKSTSNHSFRKKYRSAVYTFSKAQALQANTILEALQNDFKEPVITQVLPFQSFKPSRDSLLNYYKKNPKKPFCKKFIDPKLKHLLKVFTEDVVIDS